MPFCLVFRPQKVDLWPSKLISRLSRKKHWHYSSNLKQRKKELSFKLKVGREFLFLVSPPVLPNFFCFIFLFFVPFVPCRIYSPIAYQFLLYLLRGNSSTGKEDIMKQFYGAEHSRNVYIVIQMTLSLSHSNAVSCCFSGKFLYSIAPNGSRLYLY